MRQGALAAAPKSLGELVAYAFRSGLAVPCPPIRARQFLNSVELSGYPRLESDRFVVFAFWHGHMLGLLTPTRRAVA
jgi:hypothetical protein